MESETKNISWIWRLGAVVVNMSDPSDKEGLPTVGELMGEDDDGGGGGGRGRGRGRGVKIEECGRGRRSGTRPFAEMAKDDKLVKEMENLVARGREEFMQKNFHLAVRYFRAALALDPDNRIASFFCTKSEYEIRLARSYDRLFDLTPSVERQRYRPSPDVVTCPNCQGTSQCTYCLGEGRCPSCGGTGWRSNLDSECTVCLGSGICGLCSGSKHCIVCNGRSVVYKRGSTPLPD